MTLPDLPSWLEESPYAPKYYDMYGMPISMRRWSYLLGQDKHVAKSRFRMHGRQYYLSTVWLGLDQL